MLAIGTASAGVYQTALLRPDGFVAWRCAEFVDEPVMALRAALGASLRRR